MMFTEVDYTVLIGSRCGDMELWEYTGEVECGDIPPEADEEDDG
jgi:hypothetical protein